MLSVTCAASKSDESDGIPSLESNVATLQTRLSNYRGEGVLAYLNTTMPRVKSASTSLAVHVSRG